jgi:hypothetical protein
VPASLFTRKYFSGLGIEMGTDGLLLDFFSDFIEGKQQKLFDINIYLLNIHRAM